MLNPMLREDLHQRFHAILPAVLLLTALRFEAEWFRGCKQRFARHLFTRHNDRRSRSRPVWKVAGQFAVESTRDWKFYRARPARDRGRTRDGEISRTRRTAASK